jgi:hypothetical protein
VPLIDPRTGLIDRAWYMFFLSLFGAAQNTDDPLLAPDTNSLLASYDLALVTVSQAALTQPPPSQVIPKDIIEPARVDLTMELDALRQELGTLPPAASTPVHNSLSGLNDGDYKHLTASEYTGTGTGVFARKTSPTFVTPILGTPTSGDLTNCTFPTLNQSTTGNAAKLATSPYVYSFSGANVAIGSSVGTFSSTLPAGTSASTNQWLEVIIDTTSYWLPIWVK